VLARPLALLARVSAHRAVWAALLASAGLWTAVAGVREVLFVNKRQDLGNFTQAVWTTAHGHFLQVTEAGGVEVSRLGIHVDPIIAVFAPLWWLWSSPMLLLTVQAAAAALGAMPLFWLGRKHLSRERDAALLAVAYLISPTVAWNVVSDFHTVALAVPLLLFAIWYLDEDRYVPFAATSGMAMFCQEQIGLMVGCLGLWYAWRRRRIGAGLVVAAIGFGFSAFDFSVVLPHFSGGQGTPYADRFGGSPSSILVDLVRHPIRLLDQINRHDLLGLLLALPILGACFGSSILLAASPQIALLLLSRRPGDWGFVGINVLILVPFIYSATVFALARFESMRERREPVLVAAQVFTASLGVALVFSPVGVFGLRQVFGPHAPIGPQRDAVALVPTNASVSATNHLALPLAARRFLYVFPVIKKADWVLVDSRDDYLPNLSYIHRRSGINVGINDLYWQPKLMHREIAHLLHSTRWQLVYRRDEIYAFRRVRGN
jgi:uncharacterized membrane protein